MFPAVFAIFIHFSSDRACIKDYVFIEAPEHYDKLLAYIADHSLRISGFSREITLIDYGVTNDPEEFVTEICIPVDE